MTTMTLRHAAQIYNRIAAETKFEEDVDPYLYPRRRAAKKPILQVMASVSIDDNNPKVTLDNLRGELLEKKQQLFTLLSVGSILRQECAFKQASCGVTALVTERVAVIQQQKILEYLLKAIETTVYDPELVIQQVPAIRQRLQVAGQGQTQAHIDSPLLTASDRTVLRTELATVKRRLLEIDDKLAELNSTNSITVLDDDQMDFLHKIGIA